MAGIEEPFPEGVVTFVFTDIEGSTRLFHRIGDGYLDLLDRHHRILRDAWADHHGREVKTEGDAFFVAFAEASDAVMACAEAQRALEAEAWMPEARVRVRMGMHTGLAYPRDRDYVAFAVHQAARVVNAAHGGQMIVSSATAARHQSASFELALQQGVETSIAFSMVLSGRLLEPTSDWLTLVRLHGHAVADRPQTA